jgi:hypothetical protein
METITSLNIADKGILSNLAKILKHMSHLHEDVIIKHANDKLIFLAKNYDCSDSISYTIHLKHFSNYQIRFTNKKDLQFSANVVILSIFITEILESTNNAPLSINFLLLNDEQCKIKHKILNNIHFSFYSNIREWV